MARVTAVTQMASPSAEKEFPGRLEIRNECISMEQDESERTVDTRLLLAMALRPSLVAVTALVAVVLMESAVGRQYDRCGLVRALRSRGFPRCKIGNWVCLVEAESGGNTGRVSPPGPDGSRDYGLFQINSRYWCGIGRKGGECNMKCEDLLNDDIRDDVQCARKIYNRHGFSAWYGWAKKCKGKKLTDISRC